MSSQEPEVDFSIVLPCYNEAANIPFIYQQFRQAMGDMADMEIVLVNNGSTDDSTKVLDNQQVQYQDARFRVVTIEKNQGYGFGILSGLATARGKVLGWTHADLQTPPKDVLMAYGLFKKQSHPYAFVKGQRKNREALAQFFTWGMQTLATWVLGIKLEDIAAQPKVFGRNFYEKYLLNQAPYDFSLDLYALYWARKEGMVTEFPVVFEKRLYGEAKGGGSWKTRIKVSRRTWKYIFELRKKTSNPKN
jgi:glycosyltransferase involved in cell wall biosynthesis